MTSNDQTTKEEGKVEIEKVESVEDLEECFDCMSLAFGDEKPMFQSMYPKHSTKEGREKGIKRLKGNWLKQKDNEDFHFLKAVHYKPNHSSKIVGFAIWTVMTATKNLESEDASKEYDLEFMYPDQPEAQEWLKQVWKEYIQPRRKVVLDQHDPKPVISFELCAVHPATQRMGVGQKLSRWGVDYAKKIKAREAIVEASVPGVGCYKKAGFIHQEPIDFSKVDPKLTKVRPFPTLMFMRTGPLSN